MELLRNLEQTQASSSDVRVSEHKLTSDDRIDALLEMVEGLRQVIAALIPDIAGGSLYLEIRQPDQPRDRGPT